MLYLSVSFLGTEAQNGGNMKKMGGRAVSECE
jgi:hypothetical protein